MDTAMRFELRRLRGLSSQQAADELLALHAADPGRAQAMVGHLSWKVVDQERLAHRFLAKLPHASDATYAALASIMTLDRLLRAFEDCWPKDADASRLSLLFYYLAPTLRHATNNGKQAAKVEAWLRRMGYDAPKT